MTFADPRNHPAVIYCSIAIVAFFAGLGFYKNYFSDSRPGQICVQKDEIDEFCRVRDECIGASGGNFFPAERAYEFGLQIGQLLANVNNKNLEWIDEHATALSDLASAHSNFFDKSSIKEIKNFTREVINITSTNYDVADFEHGHDLKEMVRDDINRHSCTKK